MSLTVSNLITHEGWDGGLQGSAVCEGVGASEGPRGSGKALLEEETLQLRCASGRGEGGGQGEIWAAPSERGKAGKNYERLAGTWEDSGDNPGTVGSVQVREAGLETGSSVQGPLCP